MPLTPDELKTLLVVEYNAAQFQTQVDQAWPLWVKQHTGLPMEVGELRMRESMLTLLQGQYRNRYNVTTGIEQRTAFQQFQAITQMLENLQTRLDRIDAEGMGKTLHSSPMSSGVPDPIAEAVGDLRRLRGTRGGKGHWNHGR